MNSQVEQVAGLVDQFRGDSDLLLQSIKALVELNDAGALVPHGIGGHARVLLSAAAIRLASLASRPPVLDEREVKRAFTFAFAVGFQWASECSCVSAASIDEAWSEYTAIRNLGGPDDVA